MIGSRPDRLPGLTYPAVVIVASLMLTTTGGCKRAGSPAPEVPPTPPLPVLGEVTLRDATPAGATPPASIDLASLQGQLHDRLAASGLFASAQADAGPAAGAVVRVRAEVALDGAEVEDKGVARAAVRIRFDTRPSDAPGALDEELAGEGEQIYPIPAGVGLAKVGTKSGARAGAREGLAKARLARARSSASADAGVEASAGDAKRALFTRLVARVAGDLVDGLAAREKLRTAAAPAIHAALRADAGDLQEQAIRIAGERKLRDEVPTLLELLDNPSEPVRDAALGALIQIGDRRAVTALTKSRSLHDRREMRKILDAIATLGGDEALDYLSFVAASHDDEEIRGLAASAKLRLERRQQGKLGP